VTPHISLRLKAAMWIAFFAIMGAWAWLWTAFVHSLPMWGVYIIDAAVVISVSIYYGKQWFDRRSAVDRRVVGEHHVEAGRMRRLPGRAD
jgi:hypothetical protein